MPNPLQQPIVAIIDNYDSFTYNLLQYCEALGAIVRVYRNDAIDYRALPADTTHLIISPGPATPKEAGISMKMIEYYCDHLPILGVCLGHQCMGAIFGGKIVRAKKQMHGKISRILHDGKGVFAGIAENPLPVVRYHSLIVERDSLPQDFLITAWVEGDEQGEIMAMRHQRYRMEGVQFHPEAYYTHHGKAMIANFLSPSAL